MTARGAQAATPGTVAVGKVAAIKQKNWSQADALIDTANVVMQQVNAYVGHIPAKVVETLASLANAIEVAIANNPAE